MKKIRARKPKNSHLPLNALRAFEASARHLSFTNAGMELRVGQAAISHQVKGLELRLGVQLFRRLPRGLALTDEGAALLPSIAESFGRLRATLEQFDHGYFKGVVTVGVVGTFATGWLLPRLPAFQNAHPLVDLRIQTNNNRVDLAGEGLDFAIRFGDGSWRSTEAVRLLDAPLTVVCAPTMARRLKAPADVVAAPLLRSYRADEWALWFAAAGVECPSIKGPIFDTSLAMAEAAAQGLGAALLPAAMFSATLTDKRLVQPFAESVTTGAYYLTWLKSRSETEAMHAFRSWLVSAALEARQQVGAQRTKRTGQRR